MSKKIYIIISIIVSIMLMFLLQNEVYAASATISASENKVEPGKTVTLKANIKDSASWALDVSTTGGTLKKNDSRVGNTDSGNNESKTITLGTFTTETEGTYKITLSGYVVDGDTFSKTNVNESVSIVVEKTPVVDSTTNPEPSTPTTNNNSKPETPPTTTVKKSSEARLSNLGIEPHDFNGFSKNINQENWSAQVPNDVTEVEVYATPKDSKATVKGTGKVALKEGANTVEIKVTAEDGKTTKTYKLTINRRSADEENVVQSEARLSNLGIRPEEYDFEGFNKDKTEYSVEIPSDVEEIEVYAEAVNSNCQITGVGMITLEEGDNTLKIDVISENGTKNTYTINVKRTEAEVVDEEPEEKFGLSDLSIVGLNLSPKFDGKTYEYTVDLTEDLSELEIVTEKTDKDATIEIIGNENLQEGENVITILVKNEETEEVATYQIIVNKTIAEEEVVMSWLKPSTWGKEEYIKIAIIVVLIILIISAIILKIQIGKENNKNNEIDFPGADELDKAIAEHQELAEEEHFSEEEVVEVAQEPQYQQESIENTNYLEDIAKQRLGENEVTNVFEDDFAPKSKRKGRHF